MNIIIANISDIPIYQQITNQIKDAILKGELKEGDMLPSIRVLAKDLRVSVITTKRAYDDLEQEGYIISMAGKGSFVAAQNIEILKESRIRLVEEKLLEAIEYAKSIGISKKEIYQIMDLLYEEDGY